MDFDRNTSKYGSLTINELKKELSKRGAKLSGRKQELIERLEAYERNYNFGKNGITDIPSTFQMATPEEKNYKDLHEGLVIPDIDMSCIEAYLTPLNKVLGKDSINLVREKFLKYIKMAEQSSLTFFKSQCKAEMKKHVTYNIDISINTHGLVEECQCDCGAGMGPEAHCKHVNAVLYALFKFTASGVIMTEETCTQQLQTFHHVRRHQGSPIKACDLPLKGKPGNDKAINFEPRIQLYQATQGYKSHFRNVCINQTDSSRSPLTQMYAPANILAISVDHDYLAETPEDLFLKQIGLTSIDQKTVDTISMSTIKQSTDKTWLELRCLRLNSSDFGRICKLTDRTDKVKYAESLTMPSDLKCNAVKHGKKYEKIALETFTSKCHKSVLPCGTVIAKDCPFLASTPDGLVGENATIEVKCPYASKDMDINPKTVPYIICINGETHLNPRHQYYYQVQGQLFCTGRQECYFCVYTHTDFKTIVIKRNNEFIADMVKDLTTFFDQYFREAVLQTFFYKNTNRQFQES